MGWEGHTLDVAIGWWPYGTARPPACLLSCYKHFPCAASDPSPALPLCSFAERLLQFTDVFHSSGSKDGGSSGGGVAVHARLATQQQRTQAIAAVLEQLKAEVRCLLPNQHQTQAARFKQANLHPSAPPHPQPPPCAAATAVPAAPLGQGLIAGWRNELYPAVQAFHDEPAFLIERAAAPYFGIKAYGVHINGYVTLPDGSKELWVARRSRSKPTWPGKLDHIVAGGQPHGLR